MYARLPLDSTTEEYGMELSVEPSELEVRKRNVSLYPEGKYSKRQDHDCYLVPKTVSSQVHASTTTTTV